MPASRRDELVDAAMRVFQRHGFHGAGLEQVLQAAGISRMTLYNHFKGKDELIVAALRRRDEIFRNRLMKYVDAHAADPVAALIAVFEFHAAWFVEKDFCGCMFTSAASEFDDPDSAIRREAANHKRDMVRYLEERCEAAGLRKPAALAAQLAMLLDGATVMAQVVGRQGGDVAALKEIAVQARHAAEALIAAARPAS